MEVRRISAASEVIAPTLDYDAGGSVEGREAEAAAAAAAL